MDDRILALFHLFAFSTQIQNRVWSSLAVSESTLLNDLNAREIRLIFHIALRMIEKKPAISLNEAAEIIGIKKAAASTLVSSLVSRGILSREINPDNRRQVCITLGSKIISIINANQPKFYPQFFKLFEGISEEDLAIFVRVTNEICKSFAEQRDLFTNSK